MPNPIAAARAAKNLTQEQVAAHVGVTRGAVAQWEMEEGTRPAPEHAVTLGELLGLTLNDIYAAKAA